MAGKLCIHGHFYQPPREDPWLGRILIEPSAAPMRHWNERIVRESYAPLGWARRMDGGGKITDIMNCYEWISFNAGPTLLHWMRREAPEVLARLQEADRKSIDRWGHGNAIAQVYHHIIMPLASPLDKELECVWAIADFEMRFKRKPEGMWLSECAVDLASLEVLAAEGIKFVILAPRQAKAVAESDGYFTPVHEGTLDVTCPYKVELPSGKEIAAFFYHGGISQAIAFEGLLRDGEVLWGKFSGAVNQICREDGLLGISTDGETYGHHFKFGEMALAHALAQGIAGRDGVGLTNFAAYLEQNPTKKRVILNEPSSWSCVHGIERWRSDCGCTDGGHPGWNQQWRAPLREALNFIKKELDAHFFNRGPEVFMNPKAVLRAYGEVLADPDCTTDFASRYFLNDNIKGHDEAWKLLSMQENALAAFASCAWFFDDISRIEPVNALGFALRAMELASETGCRDFQPELEAILEKAFSNKMEEGTGRRIFKKRVLPKKQSAASLCLMALVWLQAAGELPHDGKSAHLRWPAIEVELTLDNPKDLWFDTDFPTVSGLDKDKERPEITGKATIRDRMKGEGTNILWSWLPPSNYVGVEFGGLEVEIAIQKYFSNKDSRESAFVSFLDSRIEVIMPGGEKVSSIVAELPRHVRDFFSLRMMGQKLIQSSVRRKTMARHIISTMSQWEEGQVTHAYPQLWVEFVPYLIWACCFGKEITIEQVANCSQFLKQLTISDEVKQRCYKILTHDFLHALRSNPIPLNDLIRAASCIHDVLPEMDWWRVQNEIWAHPDRLTTLKELSELCWFKV